MWNVISFYFLFFREDDMHSMRSMVRGNGMADNYVLIAGENEYFYELDLTSGYVYKKNEVSFETDIWLEIYKVKTKLLFIDKNI